MGGGLHRVVLKHGRISTAVAHAARIHRVLIGCLTGKAVRRMVRCDPDRERTYRGGRGSRVWGNGLGGMYITSSQKRGLGRWGSYRADKHMSQSRMMVQTSVSWNTRERGPQVPTPGFQEHEEGAVTDKSGRMKSDRTGSRFRYGNHFKEGTAPLPCKVAREGWRWRVPVDVPRVTQSR